MTADEHDSWNEPAVGHPRAPQLMEEALWDCTNELAPFGSDEGANAYAEFRSWREEHLGADLSECLEWIGDERDCADAFTFDATVIATILGQLVDEGRIDASVKPAARAAIARQLEDAHEDERRELLGLALQAIEKA